MTPLPFQLAAIDALVAEANGQRRPTVLTAPCGAGKTLMMGLAIERFACPTVLYTNRRMLREQTSERMDAMGIDHGVRASGQRPALLRDVQVSSLMTEHSRVFKRQKWELHKAKLALVDECHQQTGNVAKKILQQHRKEAAFVVGVTATPLDLEGIYEHIIPAAKNSDLRACGLHVPCETFAPDEPDLRHIKRVKVGEDLTDKENRRAIMRPGIFGRVWENWKALNPDGRPAILFGPDVAGSLWFAEQFWANGVTAAHIDAEKIWINGETMTATQGNREHLAELSATGQVAVVCNRFVMREGIDWPWLYHSILACVFGSLTSYLQAGGRLLRSHPGVDHVVCQDHGGNWHRHGSLNADREDWEIGDTSYRITATREERLRDKKEREPIVCSQCHKVRGGGEVCPYCGHRSTGRSRVVVQASGALQQVDGEIYKPFRVRKLPNTEDLWRRVYHRAKRSRNQMTFRQARGLFFYENHYMPPKTLPLMPTNDADWFRKVRDVPTTQLTGSFSSN